MKKFIPFLLILLSLLVLASATLYLLAETYPLHPWHRLYWVQQNVEQLRLQMAREPRAQAMQTLDLLDRRLSDLARANGPDEVMHAILAFGLALDQSIQYTSRLDEAAQVELYTRFQTLLTQTKVVVPALERRAHGPLLDWLKLKLAALENTRTASEALGLPLGMVQARAVSFMGEINHSIYPLTGQHAQTKCIDCHIQGVYASTPRDCKTCHQPPEDKGFAMLARQVSVSSPSLPNLEIRVDHYQEDCSECHTTLNWIPFRYDHANVSECSACHADDVPDIANLHYRRTVSQAEQMRLDQFAHYPGDCVDCHTSTSSWRLYSYTPTPGSDCGDCHAAHTPQGHFTALCSQCHQDVQDWTAINVDHQGFSDCLTCHSADAPGNHYQGTCSNCHNTQNWTQIHFSHLGLKACYSCHIRPTPHHAGECSDCHTTGAWQDPRPMNLKMICEDCHAAAPGHYPGTCTSCHSPSTWEKTHVNHAVLPDCTTCHAAPQAHFPGQCSLCHTANRWSEIVYMHIPPATCEGCHQAVEDPHYGLPCAACHTTAAWYPVDYDHRSNLNCLDCHTVPAQHYPGECFTCHSTLSWLDIIFDHTYFPDCISCHPGPSGHWPGQCSACHKSTTDWSNIIFDHTRYTDCKACHQRPVTHTPGQCSKCHITTTWKILLTPTPRPFTPTPTRTPDPTQAPSPTPTFAPSPTPSPTPEE